MGEYKNISKETCKKYRGYKVFRDRKLEKKNNLCTRQCKYQHNGEDLPATVQVKCKCKKNKNCGYVFKVKSVSENGGVTKAWRSWGAGHPWDDEGEFYIGVLN